MVLLVTGMACLAVANGSLSWGLQCPPICGKEIHFPSLLGGWEKKNPCAKLLPLKKRGIILQTGQYQIKSVLSHIIQ